MKIICVGRNYVEHAHELGNTTPDTPVLFLKPDSAKLRNNSPFYIPSFSKEIHYELELVVKINRVGKHILPQFAHRYYEEIGLGIDFTARDLQQELKAKGLPWEKAKAFDHSALIGDFIPLHTLPNPQSIPFSLHLNNKIVQEGNSQLMIWTIDQLIAEVSKFFTLKIGDLLFTGTPAGVGPVAIGDKLEGYIGDKKLLQTAIK